MINIDIRFLKHLLLIIAELLEIIRGKYNATPGERQYIINVAAKTKKQLKHIIKDAEDETMRDLILNGFVKEANWK